MCVVTVRVRVRGGACVRDLRDLHVSACTAVLQPVRRVYRTPLPSPPRHLQNMDEPLSNDAFNDVLDEDLGSGEPPSSHWLDVRSGNNQRMHPPLLQPPQTFSLF